MPVTTVLFLLLVVWTCLSTTSSVVVPKEWTVVINAVCQQAEQGLFPHPSPHSQVLHGVFSVSTSYGVCLPSIELYNYYVHASNYKYHYVAILL